jgi:C4-dicarboxylate-specific signal transduction histidine kinase
MTKRPCPVFGRAVQLEQVIVNLLTNAHAAVKAFCAASKSSRPGRVRVNARKSTSGNLVISIHDNGTGIDKPHLDRIFEPFFTTKDAGNGTGLGLSISCRIVASMEGRLEARNMRPHGAKFTITLPFAR